MSTVPAVKATSPKTAFYFLLLALASLIWSGQGIAAKALDPHLGPIAITFLPFYVTTLLSAAPSAKDWVRFTIAGVGGQVLAQLGMTWSGDCTHFNNPGGAV